MLCYASHLSVYGLCFAQVGCLPSRTQVGNSCLSPPSLVSVDVLILADTQEQCVYHYLQQTHKAVIFVEYFFRFLKLFALFIVAWVEPDIVLRLDIVKYLKKLIWYFLQHIYWVQLIGWIKCWKVYKIPGI